MPESEELRSSLLSGLADILRFEAANLSRDQRAALARVRDRLLGSSLLDRLRLYAGKTPIFRLIENDDPLEEVQNIMATLASKALQHGNNAEAIATWLVSGEAERGWQFTEALGFQDTQLQWFEPLVEAATTGPDPRALTAYLNGRARGGDSEWRDDLIERWLSEPRMTQFAVDAIARGPIDHRALTRWFDVIDSGKAPVSTLRALAYSPWILEASSDGLADVTVRLARDRDPDSATISLDMLAFWCHNGEHQLDGRLHEIAWSLLELTAASPQNTSLAYNWTVIAEKLAAEDPVRMTKIVVRCFQDGGVGVNDRRVEVLRLAASQEPEGVWGEIGSALLSIAEPYHIGWVLEESEFCEKIPAPILIEWVENNGETAALLLASYIKAQASDLSQIVRYLLCRFPDLCGGILRANFFSYGWMGSEVPVLEAKLAAAQRWQQDQNVNVRMWAAELEDLTVQRLKEARRREEEEEVLRR
jgi:hypothetical protein